MHNGLTVGRASLAAYSCNLGLAAHYATYALDHSVDKELDCLKLRRGAAHHSDRERQFGVKFCQNTVQEVATQAVVFQIASSWSCAVKRQLGTRGDEKETAHVTYQSREPALNRLDHGWHSTRAPEAREDSLDQALAPGLGCRFKTLLQYLGRGSVLFEHFDAQQCS